MTTFDDRERAFETKFAHDAELMFKARARRNRLFGEWLAGEMGLEADAVKDYAGSIVAADLEEEGDADVMRKVMADIADKGLSFSEHQIEKKLLEFMAEAKEQIASEA